MLERLICFFLGFLCVGVPGCCRVNRLAKLGDDPLKIALAVTVEEGPALAFTRHRNRRTQGVPQGNRSYSEFQYDPVLMSFGREVVAHGLSTGFASQRPRSMWWRVVDDDQSPDAELSMLVEQYCFCAGDPLMPVGVRWNLRVELRDLPSGQVIWRDCLDWTLALDDVSMDQLGRADPRQRSGTLKPVLGRLARRLAGHLAHQK